jgi:phosphonate C-P lyase system protein PhnG
MKGQVLQEKINRIRAILPDMKPVEIDALASALPMARAKVIQPPQAGLIMAKARDCFDTDFYLGEVLVTRAEVEYEGRSGRATLMGDHPTASLIAAVLDALAVDDGVKYLEAAHAVCSTAAQRVAERRERESCWAASTRVNFQSMAEEA